jgi:hypothetical protein
MRTLVRVQIPVETGNDAIEDGTLPKIIKEFMDKWKPEAAYFLPMDGMRTGLFVVNLTDSSQIPPLGEPFFMDLEATVELFPCMNAEDLMKGLSQVS